MAVNVRTTGIIAPATRSERIGKMREILTGLHIATSCVGAQGGNPADAIRAGADYVVCRAGIRVHSRYLE